MPSSAGAVHSDLGLPNNDIIRIQPNRDVVLAIEFEHSSTTACTTGKRRTRHRQWQNYMGRRWLNAIKM